MRGEERAGGPRGCYCRRITPACAGKRTLSPGSSDRGWESPPRARGRVLRASMPVGSLVESPPRARGRVAAAEKKAWSGRITPACAGKSNSTVCARQSRAESPPRARGRGRRAGQTGADAGITPACAGKSTLLFTRLPLARNHPRVRGEESNENAAFEGMGIPPKCKFFVLFRNVLRVPCDSRARGSKAIRLSSIRACYMLCVPNTRADHRVFHGGALFVSDIPVITKWN